MRVLIALLLTGPLLAAQSAVPRYEVTRTSAPPVIGVTGTKGKTTVSTLIGDILTRWNPESIVAGNMGISALGALGGIGPGTPVVIELSSWFSCDWIALAAGYPGSNCTISR